MFHLQAFRDNETYKAECHNNYATWIEVKPLFPVDLHLFQKLEIYIEDFEHYEYIYTDKSQIVRKTIIYFLLHKT